MLLAYRYRHATFSKAKLCCRISLSDDGKGVCSVETDAAYSGLDLEKNSWHLQKALIRSNTTGLRAGFEISNTPSCSWAHDTISIWTSGPFFSFFFPSSSSFLPCSLFPSLPFSLLGLVVCATTLSFSSLLFFSFSCIDYKDMPGFTSFLLGAWSDGTRRGVTVVSFGYPFPSFHIHLYIYGYFQSSRMLLVVGRR
ncbi:hypothetical protein CCMA1212_005847 [Trichoderma ghanense]|uniref:Uncharacterized protein n=1 Tax=Trichoderma ghanense TaxID=65468 RepID=A0ABY2H2K7_9HYPO